MGKILGIDLGTTNCCMAVFDAGVPEVIPNGEGGRTTPSIVGFTERGERLVGNIAKRQAITNPRNTVFAVKRLIGRKFASPEVQKAMAVLPYEISEAPNGDARVRIQDKEYSPAEISAIILGNLRDMAQEHLGAEVTECVVTVPAYFDDTQRQATRDGAKIAGVDVKRIINEPTAAALAYGLNQDENQTIVVYDLGGGTFDVSILRLEEGVFDVKATSGDTYLGGEDFDLRIVDWLVEEVPDRGGHRSPRRLPRPAAPEGSGREGQVRSLLGDEYPGEPALHRSRRLGSEASQRRAGPGAARVDDDGSHRAHSQAMRGRAPRSRPPAFGAGSGDSRRRSDPHAEGRRVRLAGLRSFAPHGGEPGGSRRHGRRHPGVA